MRNERAHRASGSWDPLVRYADKSGPWTHPTFEEDEPTANCSRMQLMSANHRRRLIFFLVPRLSLLACALLLSSSPSLGYCTLPHPEVICQFLNSDEVFAGTVVSIQKVPAQGEEIDGWLYSLTVQEWFRGPHTAMIEVFTENSSGRFPLDVGKKYLLFAYRFEGQLQIDCCGNNSLVSNADSALRELRKLRVPGAAFIEGRISILGFPDNGVPAINVVFRSGDRTFKATTDPRGWFHLNVPPGKYSARVQHTNHWDVVPDANSADNPGHFNAREGQCTQLQFSATSR